MQVYFYKQFKKKQNSTKQPAANSHDRILSCQLKHESTIESPVLLLSYGASGWQDTLNYAYIPSWGRYYKVMDATYNGAGHWEVALQDDALASNKAEILNTTAFIEYSGLSGETYIPDTRLTMRGNLQLNSTTIEGWGLLAGDLYYYVTVNSADGADRCYQMSRNAYEQFCSGLSGIGGSDLDKIALQCSSAFGAITRVLAIPFDLHSFVTTGMQSTFHVDCAGYSIATSAQIHYWDDSTNNKFVPYIYSQTDTVTVPWDNDISDYRNLSPFTVITLYLPYYGQIEIDPALLIGYSSVNIKSVISIRDGSVTYRVRAQDYIIGIYTAQIAQEVAIGQSLSNTLGFYKNAADTALGVAGSAATGNFIGVAQSATSGLINMGVASLQHSVSTKGSSTGLPMRSFQQDYELSRYSYPAVTTPANLKPIIGAPYMRVDTLSGHEGYYVKTNNAQVEISHYAGEADLINNALNSGVFLE